MSSIAVGQILSTRELAMAVSETLREIEDDMEFRNAKAPKWNTDGKPAHWRMSELGRERVVELRLRMERISTAG